MHRLENLTTMVSLDLGLSGLNLFGCGANKSRTQFCVFSASAPLDRIPERYNASTEGNLASTECSAAGWRRGRAPQTGSTAPHECPLGAFIGSLVEDTAFWVYVVKRTI
jgi:hypothetical protein